MIKDEAKISKTPCYILQGKKESCARIERGKEEEDAIEAKKGWMQTQKSGVMLF